MEPISEMANALPNVWNFVVGLHRDYINQNGFVYACDYETRINLDLIDSLKLDGLKGKTGTEAFHEFVNSFETNAIHAIIVGSDREQYKTLVKLLKKHWKPFSKQFEDETKKKNNTDTNGSDTIENVLENFSFVVRKIEVLKRINSIAEKDETILKDFYLSKRLKNIKTALLNIRNCLKEVINELEHAN